MFIAVMLSYNKSPDELLCSRSQCYCRVILDVQELEKMAADLTEQKKNIEDAAKILREEKDTTET